MMPQTLDPTLFLIFAGIAMTTLIIFIFVRPPKKAVEAVIYDSWTKKIKGIGAIVDEEEVKIGPKVFQAVVLDSGARIVFLEGRPEEFAIDVDLYAFRRKEFQEVGRKEREFLATAVLDPDEVVEKAFGREKVYITDSRGKIIGQRPWLDEPASPGSEVTNREVLRAFVEELMKKNYLFVVPRIPRGILPKLASGEWTYQDAVHAILSALRERDKVLQVVVTSLYDRVIQPSLALNIALSNIVVEYAAQMEDAITILSEVLEAAPHKVKESVEPQLKKLVERVKSIMGEVQEAREVVKELVRYLPRKDQEELMKLVGLRAPKEEVREAAG